MFSGHSTVQENLPVVLLYLKSSTLRACPRDPKAVLFRLAKFLLEALHGLYLTCVDSRQGIVDEVGHIFPMKKRKSADQRETFI